jgi:sec-independent protein translocase protein TatC
MSAHSTQTDKVDSMNDESRMSWRDHVADLRHSIIVGFGGVFLCCLLSLFFFEEIYEIVTRPLYGTLERLNLDKAIKFRTVQGAFFFHIKTAILSGLVLGMPILTYQLWRFIAPGLYRNERKVGMLLVVTTTLFFISGIVFGYYMIMPYSFDYLLSYTMTMSDGSQLLPDITLEDYVGTFIKLIMASGIAFETPVFIGFLAYIGLVTHHHLIAGWRWATVFAFVLAAILTPPDYITQSLLALPLMFFYVISIFVALYISKRNERKLQELYSAPDQTNPESNTKNE